LEILQQANAPRSYRHHEEEEKATGYRLHDWGSIPGMGGLFCSPLQPDSYPVDIDGKAAGA
jgi:hypothetical protein